MFPSGRPLFRPAFDVLDTDGDGRISREDLQSFYTDEDVIGSMISSADFNRNGVVEYEEFERILSDSVASGDRGGVGVMEEVFKSMDADGDGRVSYSDLKTYLSGAGLVVSDEEIEAMILLGGGGPDGVSYEGLLAILAIN
ncbi:hypothetical protein QQ045_032067 [Rhodiola kirilowii]